MLKLQKQEMRSRPSYDELVRDTILEPKDKIALPDRRATQLRKMQQLSQYDDPQFLDLDQQSKEIMKQEIHNHETKNIIQNNTNVTPAEHAATSSSSKPPDAPQPPSYHSFTIPKLSSSTQTDDDTVYQSSTFNKPPPPPSSGAVKKATVEASTQTAQQFDMSMDDHMDDMDDDYSKILKENEESKKAKPATIATTIQTHLGPHSSTADQSYVSQLTEQQLNVKPRERSRDRVRLTKKTTPPPEDVVMTSSNYPPAPPAPPAQPITMFQPLPKSVKIKSKTKERARTQAPRSRKKKEDDIVPMELTPNVKPDDDTKPAREARSRTPARKRVKSQPPKVDMAVQTEEEKKEAKLILQPKAKPKAKSAAGPLPKPPKSTTPEPPKRAESLKPSPLITQESKRAKRAKSVDSPDKPPAIENIKTVTIPKDPPKPKSPPKQSTSPEQTGGAASSSTTRGRPRTRSPSRKNQNQLLAPSQIKTAGIDKVKKALEGLINDSRFNREEAEETLALIKELNADPPQTRKREINARFKEIYLNNRDALI